MELIDNMVLTPSRIRNWILIHHKHVSVGKNVKIEGTLSLYGKAKSFIIEDNVRIISCRKKNPLGGGTRTVFFFAPDAMITIGENSGISNSVFRIRKKLYIGKNVNIGGDCKFYDSDMHSVDYKDRISVPDLNVKNAPITIKDGVWIGAHSIVLKGVTIGERSVVAAGSVVTKSIPNDELWGGNPARFIKKINLKK